MVYIKKNISASKAEATQLVPVLVGVMIFMKSQHEVYITIHCSFHMLKVEPSAQRKINQLSGLLETFKILITFACTVWDRMYMHAWNICIIYYDIIIFNIYISYNYFSKYLYMHYLFYYNMHCIT